FYDKRYSHSYMEALPDFVKLAESFGHVGMRVEKSRDVDAALKEALGMRDRLVLLDFITDQTENVYPMVAAGKGQHEMHLSPHRELACPGFPAPLPVRHILSLLVENEAGALSRISGLFSARAFNIES